MQAQAARAFLGISHSPLLGIATLPPAVERPLREALHEARRAVRAFQPELIVLIGPDHYNGFFHELMPPFCIGTDACAVGDYHSLAGRLEVDAQAAESLASHLMHRDFDVALSRRMKVDHGFSQVLELIWDGLDTPPVLPIFLNAVVHPVVPTLTRCHRLGAEIGNWARPRPQRVLFIGSGGLSHEPPIPSIENADPQVRARLMSFQEPTPEQRQARIDRALAAGKAMAAGDPGCKALNPEWDARWMRLIEEGAYRQLCGMAEDGIAAQAGASAHESKTWLVARSALPPQSTVCIRHYQAIPELIAGFGLMFALDRSRP